MKWKVNTSNAGKLEEYQTYLGDIEAIRQDLPEPEADPITIVRYKASQFENVIIDDVGLYIEGEDVGVNIRWLLDQLNNYIGKRATFVCLVAIHRNHQVEIFEGRTSGILVNARGNSFGFNNYFLPDGADKTFGEEKTEHFNPRYHALMKLVSGQPTQVEMPLIHWSGTFQAE